MVVVITAKSYPHNMIPSMPNQRVWCCCCRDKPIRHCLYEGGGVRCPKAM